MLITCTYCSPLGKYGLPHVPTSVAVSDDGVVYVAFQETGEIAVLAPGDNTWDYITIHCTDATKLQLDPSAFDEGEESGDSDLGTGTTLDLGCEKIISVGKSNLYIVLPGVDSEGVVIKTDLKGEVEWAIILDYIYHMAEVRNQADQALEVPVGAIEMEGGLVYVATHGEVHHFGGCVVAIMGDGNFSHYVTSVNDHYLSMTRNRHTGDFLVADYSGIITVLSPSGEPLREYEGSVDFCGESVAIDSRGMVHVAAPDYDAHAVVYKYDCNKFCEVIPPESKCNCVAVASDDSVFIGSSNMLFHFPPIADSLPLPLSYLSLMAVQVQQDSLPVSLLPPMYAHLFPEWRQAVRVEVKPWQIYPQSMELRLKADMSLQLVKWMICHQLGVAVASDMIEMIAVLSNGDILSINDNGTLHKDTATIIVLIQ